MFTDKSADDAWLIFRRASILLAPTKFATPIFLPIFSVRKERPVSTIGCEKFRYIKRESPAR